MKMKSLVTIIGLAVMLSFFVPCTEAMIRHIFIFDVGDRAIADRAYFTWHAQECVRLFGPWLRRYWTYRLYDVPAEADRFNVRRGRLTELWYESFEDWKEADPNRNNFYYPDSPEGWDKVGSGSGSTAALFVTANPTEDFLDQGGKPPREGPRYFLRWIITVKYPEGQAVDKAEEWYLNTHAQELKTVPGLLRFVSWRVPDEARQLAEYGHNHQYHRLTELWFENYDAWRSVFIEDPPELTAPPWTTASSLEQFYEMVSGFVGTRPDVDFLRDDFRVP